MRNANGELKTSRWLVANRAVRLLIQKRIRLGTFRKHLMSVRPD